MGAMCAKAEVVPVPTWEEAADLIPTASKGCKGDQSDEVIQAVMGILKRVIPGWEHVPMDRFSFESISGGYQGTVPLKCTVTDGSQPECVVFKLPEPGFLGESEEGETLAGAAFNAWSDLGVVPTAFCHNENRLPGVQVSEFISGGNSGTVKSGHGADCWHDETDAKAFGAMCAKIHAAKYLEADWYQPYKGQVKKWDMDAGKIQLHPEFSSFIPGLEGILKLCDERDGYDDVRALTNVCIKLKPFAHSILEDGSLLGREVFGHGDLHGCNTMHRKGAGHGQLVAVDLDMAGSFPAATDLGTILYMDYSTTAVYFFGHGQIGEYPSLERRRQVAQAYIENTPDAADFSRTAVDEVVFDMEVGRGMRGYWLSCLLLMFLGPRAAYDAPMFLIWKYLWNTKMMIDVLAKAKSDPDLQAAIVEKGVDKYIVDDGGDVQDVPASFWTRSGGAEAMWNKYGRNVPVVLPSAEARNGGALFTAANMDELASGMSAASTKYEYGRLAIKSLLGNGVVNDDVLKTLFDKFDTDGSGAISVDELQKLSHCTGVSLTAEQAAETLAKLDKDGNGTLGFDEFSGWLKEAHAASEDDSGDSKKVTNPMNDE